MNRIPAPHLVRALPFASQSSSASSSISTVPTALTRSLLVCLGLGLCLASATHAAGGRSSSRQGGSVHTQTTGPQGQTVTRDTVRTPTQTTSTVTAPTGETATREVNRSPQGSDATLTGPQGQTVTRTSTPTADGTTTTVTGPNGQTATREVSRSLDQFSATVETPAGTTTREVVRSASAEKKVPKSDPSIGEPFDDGR